MNHIIDENLGILLHWRWFFINYAFPNEYACGYFGIKKNIYELKIKKKITEMHRITGLSPALWIVEYECYEIGWISSLIKI